jgi:hypothetical protein
VCSSDLRLNNLYKGRAFTRNSFSVFLDAATVLRGGAIETGDVSLLPFKQELSVAFEKKFIPNADKLYLNRRIMVSDSIKAPAVRRSNDLPFRILLNTF